MHILVIPKKEIPSIAHLEDSDAVLMGHLFNVVRKIAAEQGLTNGFRTVINTGKDGGQTVDHLHIHLMGKTGSQLATRVGGWQPQDARPRLLLRNRTLARSG